MKHFVIGYGIGFHTFEYACTTAHEALEALEDLFAHDPKAKKWEMDKYMEILLDIKAGKKTGYNENPIFIHYLPGEV